MLWKITWFLRFMLGNKADYRTVCNYFFTATVGLRFRDGIRPAERISPVAIVFISPHSRRVALRYRFKAFCDKRLLAH